MTSVSRTTPTINLREQAVNDLHHAVKLLFPDPNPDIFTLDNYQFQFKLRTGLKENAIRAIEQSQRINRRSGNYQRAGLCEFHIGLIYLDAADFRGARQQFTQARRQWSFVHEPAAETLSFVAEGVAHHLAHHYEAAMASYSKANQSLPRVRFALPVHYKDRVYDTLAKHVETYQTMLRDQMWPEEEETDTAVPPPIPDPATAHATPIPEQQTPAYADEQSKPQAKEKQESSAALPIINYETETTPIPAHQYLGDQYEWFLIDMQPEAGFFPLDVQQGGWLLVDKKPSLRSGELVLVKGREDYRGLNGRLISVSPVRARAASHIYLAWLDHTPQSGQSENDEPSAADEPQFHITISPDLAQIKISHEDIVGIVVGFWLPVQIR